jgi:hypothetical protein
MILDESNQRSVPDLSTLLPQKSLARGSSIQGVYQEVRGAALDELVRTLVLLCYDREGGSELRQDPALAFDIEIEHEGVIGFDIHL